jgi:hypothetical protein
VWVSNNSEHDLNISFIVFESVRIEHGVLQELHVIDECRKLVVTATESRV